MWLGWDQCRAASGLADLEFACDDTLARRSLVCALQSPTRIDSVIAAEIVLDVQSASIMLPDFWRFDPAGCNAGGLTASIGTTGECPDLWGGYGSALVADATWGQPRNATSQIRIRATASVASVQARTVEPGVVYEFLRLDFDGRRLESCVGCAVPACLVLNSVWLRRLGTGGDVLLFGDGGIESDRVTWWLGAGADCLAVPASRPTWGALKVRYR